MILQKYPDIPFLSFLNEHESHREPIANIIGEKKTNILIFSGTNTSISFSFTHISLSLKDLSEEEGQMYVCIYIHTQNMYMFYTIF